MIIKRQKNFSVVSKLIDVVKSAWNYLKSAGKGLKHAFVKGGKVVSEHDSNGVNQKNFSIFGNLFKKNGEDDFTRTTRLYDTIPGYLLFESLRESTIKIFGLNSQNIGKFKELVSDKFPIFINICSTKSILKQREESKKEEGKDYSFIFSLYGDELTFLYDFNEESWFMFDNTYNPRKEFKIGNIYKALATFFNPEEDEILKKRLEVLEQVNPEVASNLRRYFEAVRSILLKQK